ncbi:MTH1187 family thiamine-binding protein [Alkalihalobacillus oceani]|uniref:MTH1187 family thiamine-binding protein n=1 Tax=Halalkalibacter oceani TaxID=1653776 RepID=A0A9X2DKT0_9BACI|nr:MTH1187 family thiamine-binding protein [Halalkalibacter oceani]MCM3712509.1 MTH1187 family thiamine-binding protein [Halalkalibacter oceani]
MNNVTAGFQVLPNGQDVDTNGMIPRIVEVVKESGLRYHVGPMETVVEGNIDEVFSLLKRTQELGVELGASEVLTNIKIHYNPDGVSIEDKMTHVN